jgi:hypothetical protein
LAFSVIGLSLLFVGIIFAQTVPQKIGFTDLKFESLKKEVCQDCHESSMVDTHHDTKEAVAGNCASCHTVSTQPGSVGVSLKRDCMTCHEQSPHHATEDAKNKNCTVCHDNPGVSDYSTEVPPYKPSRVTPTPANCRLCHGEGTVDGQKIVAAKDTHHGISFKGCNICHDQIVLSNGQAQDDTQKQDDKKSTNIRICERCHSVKALHEVVPHVEKEACAVCHGGKAVATQPKVEENATQPQVEEQ